MTKKKSADTPTKLVLKLTFARDTKNKYVFEGDGDDAPIPSLYISKSAFQNNPPGAINVTIEESGVTSPSK